MTSIGATEPVTSDPARAFAYRMLAPLARVLVDAGVSAGAVTAAALMLSFGGAVLLAFGRFDVAAPLIAMASVGDALDGIVARMAGTASPAGALFDAASDRYQELLIFGGLAVHMHEHVAVLVLVFAAVLASFMVSYGSAKAEALRVPVPEGSMRRFERALCLSAGVLFAAVAGSFALAPLLAEMPIIVSLALIAVVGNVSAVLRMRMIAARAPRMTHWNSSSTAGLHESGERSERDKVGPVAGESVVALQGMKLDS